MHVLHVKLEALGRLSRVTDRPGALVDFIAQDVFGHRLVVLAKADCLPAVLFAKQLVGKSELFRQQIHDGLIGLGFEQRLHHLFTPLDRTIGGRTRTVCFKLRCCRQQVDRTPLFLLDALDRHVGHRRRR